MATSSGGGDGRRSWAQLKTTVLELRRQLSALSTTVPSSISFRSLPDGRTRIYFLSMPRNGWETTLLYADVGGGTMVSDTLAWWPVIEGSFQGVRRFSREEQLLWERKRLATWGITSYELHPVSGKLVFPAASSLFQCLDTGFSVSHYFVFVF